MTDLHTSRPAEASRAIDRQSVDRLFDWTFEEAIAASIRGVPLTVSQQGHLQAQLRASAAERFPSLFEFDLGGVKDPRSQLWAIAQELGADKADLGLRVKPSDWLWGAAHSLALISRALPGRRSRGRATTSASNPMLAHAEDRAFDLVRQAQEHATEIAEFRSVLSTTRDESIQLLAANSSSTACASFVAAALSALREPQVTARLTALLYLRPYGETQSRVLMQSWVFVHLLREITLQALGLESHWELFGRVDASHELLATSADDNPWARGGPFGSKTVRPGVFMTGAALLSASPIRNRQPHRLTNLDHVREMAPRRVDTIPIRDGTARFAVVCVRFVGDAEHQDGEDAASEIGHLLSSLLPLRRDERPSAASTNRFRAAPVANLRQALLSTVTNVSTNDDDTRLAIVVVASQNASSLGRSDYEREALRHVLGAWAQGAALEHLPPGPVFETTSPFAFVSVNPGVSEDRWRDLRDRGVLPHYPGMIGRCTDDTEAGYLGSWSIGWRTSWIANARKALGTDESVVDLLEQQIRLASENIRDLSSINIDYQNQSYVSAYAKARAIAEHPLLICGIAVVDVIRLSLLRQDIDTAREYAARVRAAPLWDWDITAHSFYLMAVLAAGQFKEAEREIVCPLCAKFPLPTGIIARTLAKIVSSQPESDAEFGAELLQCGDALSVLAPNQPHRDEVILSPLRQLWRAVRTQDPSRMRSIADSIRLRRLTSEVAELSGERRYWAEMTALRVLSSCLEMVALHGAISDLTRRCGRDSVSVGEPVSKPSGPN